METQVTFKSIKFKNYKALRSFTVTLRRFNVLVGPNNSGKSTILNSFRILSEGIRRARARKPEIFHLVGKPLRGYRVFLENLPISTENVFTDYDESNPASIKFNLSNGNELELVFPEVGVCYLYCKAQGNTVLTPTQFKRQFPATIGFVPVLGPVEHEEKLYQQETARLALLSHGASRNFRNIWYHFRDNFDEFRELIQTTWPGMDIELPFFYNDDPSQILHMFCPEKRFPREIYWAGFGFQVWCQMLTYTLGARNDSILIIDEPDIYLHSDLQRQLLSYLQELGPDIVLATHSTEIISEVEPSDIIIINKNEKTAKRLKEPSGLISVFEDLGSNLNPTLTQLAKTRRGLFVEGKDFQILGAFAKKMNLLKVSTRSDFTVLIVEGFNPEKVKDYSKGIELTLGTKIIKGVIFDRDYKSDQEVNDVKKSLSHLTSFAHVHSRKEIENYLLEISPLEKAIKAKVKEQSIRTGKEVDFKEDVESLLLTVTEALKTETQSQFYTKRIEYKKKSDPKLDPSTVSKDSIEEFESSWKTLEGRIRVVSGKQALSELNKHLQKEYGISLTPLFIANKFSQAEIPKEIEELLLRINTFRSE